jgi:hypothetical protein
VRPPDGRLVTFLDDGVAAVAGSRTARSIAETAVADAAPVPETRDRAPARRNAAWVGGGLVALALGAMVSVSWSGGGEADELEPRPAAPAAAMTAEAAPVQPAVAPPERDVAPAPAPAIEAPPAPAPPTRRAQPRVAPGTVKVSTSPWARVRVVGHGGGCAETPCSLSLPPGRYSLRLENPHQPGATFVKVLVESGKTSYVQAALPERE